MPRVAAVVSNNRWVPPAAEARLGLEFYATDSPGTAGHLKSSSEGFRVTEISSYPLPDPDGAYVVLRVSSRDWEQHELADALGRALGLPPRAVRWAGTKDRRAVAERLFSYRGRPPDRELALPNVTVVEAYRARDGLTLGHHYGNRFDLLVDHLETPVAEALDSYRAVAAELRARGGLPNFFGPQRFGEVRPVTHEVGRWLIRGDVERAVDVYLTEVPADGCAGTGDLARRDYASHHDPTRALREFPREYRFERTILQELEQGRGAVRAFRSLSRELRTLFVHAFQSLIFNRWLSARHASDLAFDRPVDGDRVVRLARDGTVRGAESTPVTADNLSECIQLVGRGRALVAGPLVGFDTPTDPGAPGALLECILADEGVDRSMFGIPKAPELASRGTWRAILVPPPPIGIDATDGGVCFRFGLPKGAYATVLAREFLKNGATARAPPDASKRAY